MNHKHVKQDEMDLTYSAVYCLSVYIVIYYEECCAESSRHYLL